MLRILFLIVGGTVGMLGIVGLMLYCVHKLATLDQFGTSYLAPYAPRKNADLKDGLFTKPIYEMNTRPESIRGENKTRQRRRRVEK